MSHRRTPRTRASLPLPHRLVASGCAAIVLLLTILAVSPTLHDWMHGHASPAHDRCAVVLFATGVVLAAAAVLVVPRAEWWEHPAILVHEILLVAPRYLRRPERGPPAS